MCCYSQQESSHPEKHCFIPPNSGEQLPLEVNFLSSRFCNKNNRFEESKDKYKDYVIFEKIRKNRGGGGLLTGVHKNLEPVSVSDDNDDEILVVEAKVADKKVRLINAYGPQESCHEDEKNSFSGKLDEEIKRAQLSGSLICLELDANSKLGLQIIPGDPHPQSRNGKCLEKVVTDNDLIVVNSLDLCVGKITRSRQTIHRN